MQADHFQQIAPRWILCGVQPPQPWQSYWTCLLCRSEISTFQKLIFHLEHCGKRHHILPFCCLHCAEAHHSIDALTKHTKNHLPSNAREHSMDVCIFIDGGHHQSKTLGHYDEARDQGQLMAQDIESGEILPVYKEPYLGNFYSMSLDLSASILILIFVQYVVW